MMSYFRHIRFSFFKLGTRRVIGYKKLISAFKKNEWVKVNFGYAIVYYSSNTPNVLRLIGSPMPVRNKISEKVIIIDLKPRLILNPITYYRFFNHLKSNPPLSLEERKIENRDQLIDSLL